MTQVTAIDAYWLGECGVFCRLGFGVERVLAEFGSVFYSVKEKNFDDRGKRRQADREFSKRTEIETEIAQQREAYARTILVGWIESHILLQNS
jgi:pre-mRNA-splicing factor ATP-dependent RNA helicase DHX38/PRP16